MNPFMLLFSLFGLASLSTTGSGGASGSTTGSAANIPNEDDSTGDTGQSDTPDIVPAPTTGSDSTGDSPPVVVENPAPAPTPNVDITAPDQVGSTAGNSGSTTTLENSVSVMAGRVTTLALDDTNIQSVRILSDVDHGNITVNPDNSLALVMTKSDFTGAQSFTYEISYANGTTATYQTNLNVTPGAQEGGWGTGESHYVLATDEDGRTIVEHGENHQKLYVSGSDDALTASDIAAMEGMSVNQVTSQWLADSDYGKTEDLALHKSIGMDTWYSVTPGGSETSNWLLLEKGYEYELPGRFLVGRTAEGESELHPIYMGAYGDGDRPEITSEVLHQDMKNVVIQDIHFTGTLNIQLSHNIIFDNIMVSDSGSAFQGSSGITVRNSEFIDNRRDAPQGDDWVAGTDRSAGVYMNTTDGALWENNFFDANGWDPDWETNGGQPPSMFSHNMYLDAEISDLTLRDTISMRGASFGAQARSGGYIEDNLFTDNNAGFLTLGGDYNGTGPVGEYSLLSGNVVTYAGYNVAPTIGALTMGLHDQAQMTSFVDNIVAHLSDPNADESDRLWNHGGFEMGDTAYYDDTVVHNWSSFRLGQNDNRITEQNTEGLDQAALDQTTIQLFTEQLTGIQNATTADLSNYLRAQADGALDNIVDADLINRFFQEGFGVATDIRDSAETMTFVPDDVSGGVRWDNRLNWDTEDLPGLFPEDDVDLNGNSVVYGSNTTIDTLDLSGGDLSLYGGRLEATGGLKDTGAINLEGTGQLWVGGSDGSALDIDVTDSARFVNTGDFSGADLTAEDGQVVLATDGGRYSVGTSNTLRVFEAAKVGFDDDNGDIAILDVDGGTVAFEASGNSLGEISEFRSGAMGESSDVQSGINLGDGTLSVNLSGLSAADGARFELMNADEIVGIFNEALIDDLGSRDARVIIDYANDSVTLELSNGGSGAVSIDTVGSQNDTSPGAEALWDALTSDQGVVSDTNTASLDDDDDDVDFAA